MQTIAGTQYEKETEANDQKDDTDAEEEIQPLSLSDADFKNILSCGKLSLDGEHSETKTFRSTHAKTILQREYAKAQLIGEHLWQTPPITGEMVKDTNPCAEIPDSGKKHLEERKKSTDETQEIRRANTAGNLAR